MKNSSKNISIKPGQIYEWYVGGEFVDKMTITAVKEDEVEYVWHDLDDTGVSEGCWYLDDFHFDKESFPNDYVVLDTISAFNELLDKYYGGFEEDLTN